jgi:uncharacterized peroxidase-related enzyme
VTRDTERLSRSAERPIVGGLPDVPGIGVAMRLTSGLGHHLRGLADEVLVKDYPGATISRAEREMLAAATSAANDCFFCMDSHAAHAAALLERSDDRDQARLLEVIPLGESDGFDPKMQALLHVARTVGRNPLELTTEDVEAVLSAGGSDGDVQLAVLIASAFSMYNRLVDGFRAHTPANVGVYRARASEIAEHGYGAPSPLQHDQGTTNR